MLNNLNIKKEELLKIVEGIIEGTLPGKYSNTPDIEELLSSTIYDNMIKILFVCKEENNIFGYYVVKENGNITVLCSNYAKIYTAIEHNWALVCEDWRSSLSTPIIYTWYADDKKERTEVLEWFKELLEVLF